MAIIEVHMTPRRCLIGATAALTFAIANTSAASALDPLAPRDSWGLLHQTPILRAVNFAPRESWRYFYYSHSGRTLSGDAAYIGAVQTALQRNGYYCGPINGFFTPAVSEAIARMQKNHSLRVTGTLTLSVRRALFLP